jgi:hypothetical protein
VSKGKELHIKSVGSWPSPTNIRQGCKDLQGTNALAYYEHL